MADLGAALSRLEAVTHRLEGLEASLRGAAPAAASGLPAAAPGGGGATAAASGGAVAGALLGSYDAAVSTAAVVQAAAQLGGEVAQVTQHLSDAFQGQRRIIAVSLASKQPDAQQLQALLQPVAAAIMAAGALAEQRRSPCFQQHKAVAEALAALSWLAYTGPACGMPAPAQFIGESWGAAEFYANKLLMEHRGKDEAQVAWVRALKELMLALQGWLRSNAPSGLRWNPAGCSVQQAEAQLAAGAPAGGAKGAPTPAGAKPAGPPPPPPPPPPGLLLQERPGASAAAGAGAAAGAAGGALAIVFAELSTKGDSVTSGLRKVTADMKTKNRAPDAAAPAPGPGSRHVPAPAPAASGRAAQPSGTPKVALEQERWLVEYQAGAKELVLDQTDPRHAVYIYGCTDSVVQIKGKVKSVAIDGCTKTGVVFGDVIAACEIVNCSRLQVQCTGKVRTVSIDKTDGAQVFLPAGAEADPDFQLVTAKCSEINVVVAPADYDAGEDREHAVPEQYISTFQGGKLVTVAASHSAG